MSKLNDRAVAGPLKSFDHHSRVTMRDVSIVGNTYFSHFFHWQAMCLERWMRVCQPTLWEQVRAGDLKLHVYHWSTRFQDPIGATLNDDITTSIALVSGSTNRFTATTAISKSTETGSCRIASGNIEFGTHFKTKERKHADYSVGPSFSIDVTHALILGASRRAAFNFADLFDWQGKCRELFLINHAPKTVASIAKRRLLLQTTTAEIELVRAPPVAPDAVRVEMRLTKVRCGQLSVRFDYFARSANGALTWFAKGEQTISSKRNTTSAAVPCPLPSDLLCALRTFTRTESLQTKIDEVISFSSSKLDCES